MKKVVTNEESSTRTVKSMAEMAPTITLGRSWYSEDGAKEWMYLGWWQYRQRVYARSGICTCTGDRKRRRFRKSFSSAGDT